jgi:hypothetical protein|nr:MAG TPA: hypothetical protein [Caudoviricetes sp.]
MALNEQQITDLAKPLKGILEKFYQDPENEKGFQKWLQEKEKGSTAAR